jgi:hypothetical protein
MGDMLTLKCSHIVSNLRTFLFLIALLPLLLILYSFDIDVLQAQENPLESVPTDPAASQVLVINQVRGTECCDPGSLAHLQLQLKAHEQLQIPATFAFRYDALKDPSLVTALKTAQRRHPELLAGLLLEITPALAQAAGVEYQATSEDWYEAHHVFSLGYSPEDRIKLMDTLFAEYHAQFGAYPEVTTAWIMDTPTLNYLHDQYGVRLHQITREQWGVDSYTLAGGPPHYPYPASRSWAFTPDYSQENPLWIVRQTVTDPLFNYGDTSSSFTSQPNDYARGQRDLGYFEALFTQAIVDQPTGQAGFALLGLENSMELKYQEAFLEQLAIVRRLQNEHKLSYYDIDGASLSTFANPVSIYSGTDFVEQTSNVSWWITTPQYRVRLRLNNNQLLIDDLRIFSAALPDPYSSQVAVNKGYWIQPSLLDGSLWYGERTSRPILVKLFGPPEVKGYHFSPTPDLHSQPVSLVLPTVATGTVPEAKVERGEGRVSFISSRGEDGLLRFTADKILFENVTPTDIQCPAQIPAAVPLECEPNRTGLELSWKSPVAGKKSSHLFKITCTPNQYRCQGSFEVDSDQLVAQRESQYPFFFPEARPRELSSKYTLLSAHNRYAIAGRNPVRLVLVAADVQGFPTVPQTGLTVTAKPTVAYTSSKQESVNSPLQLVDLINNKPQKSTVEVTVDDTITKTMTVYFAPNCKQDLRYCVTHPRQAWWYLNAILRDKFRARVFGETQ